MLKGILFVLSCLIASSAFAGIFGSSKEEPAPKIQPLTVQIINSNKGDMEGLWKNWLAPQLKWSPIIGWSIQFSSGERMGPVGIVVINEFGKFCEASGGKATPSEIKYGNTNTCTSPNGEFMGMIHAERFDEGLQIFIDTPKARERALAAKRDFEQKKLLNGPSGWIVTNTGRYQFVRFGTLEKRFLLTLSCCFYKPEYGISLENIRSVNINDTHTVVITTDGKTLDNSLPEFIDETNNIDLIMAKLPFVLIDSNGFTYEQFFSLKHPLKISNSDRSETEVIREIHVDDEQAWKDKPNNRLVDFRTIATSTSIPQLSTFISERGNDAPEKLVVNAKVVLANLIAERDKEVARAKAEAIQKARLEAKEDAARKKSEEVKKATEHRQLSSFRKSLRDGDETNCGPIIEVKGKLVKISFPVANYGNEHWIHRDEILPAGYGCHFVNGQYQSPD